jgi:hypothetical protein
MFRYAFVTFRRAGEATQARHMLNGRHVCGHEVKVRKCPMVLSLFFIFVQLTKSAVPYRISSGLSYFRIAVTGFDKFLRLS